MNKQKKWEYQLIENGHVVEERCDGTCKTSNGSIVLGINVFIRPQK